MLTVGDRFPDFRLTGVVSLDKGHEFEEVSLSTCHGRWFVFFFWPMDFTFICPTEIADFGRRIKDFDDRDIRVLGASIDTHYVHLAWRQNHEALRNLPFPMLSDTKRELSTSLGILHTSGVALRATFAVDPEGVIRWVSVNDLTVGRNTAEVLRVLDALQTGDLCPCNWEKGMPTLGK
jgi:alkyl hydroperoxide reductase subunit AhpC